MKNFIVSALLLFAITSYSQNGELTVIGNKIGVPGQLSMAGLKSVIKGDQAKWANGQKVIIALMKLNTDAGKSVCSKLYGMNAAEVTKHWLTVSMKGNIDAPIFFNTAAELQSFVAGTSGAIGVLDATASGGKTVLIDGKKTF